MFEFKFKKTKFSGNGQVDGQTDRQANKQGGFLLTELIVAVFIFGIVMTISVGSLVVALDANKKAQSLKSVLNNLNVVLDTMTKALATGTHYYCGVSSAVPPQTQDCGVEGGTGTGETAISFLFNEDLGENGEVDDIIVYSLNDGGGKGFIERTLYINRSTSYETIGPIRMTAPEVNITDMKFYVLGSTLVSGAGGDFDQPKVLITIDGNALAGPRNQPTAFTVQTIVSQRVPDFKPDS